MVGHGACLATPPLPDPFPKQDVAGRVGSWKFPYFTLEYIRPTVLSGDLSPLRLRRLEHLKRLWETELQILNLGIYSPLL